MGLKKFSDVLKNKAKEMQQINGPPLIPTVGIG